MDIRFIFEIATALGIIALIKGVFIDPVGKALLDRNSETRVITTKIMKAMVWLKYRDMKELLPTKSQEDLYRYVHMLPIRDEDLSDDVMSILNKHKIYISDLKGNRKESEIVKNKNELFGLTDRIVNKCNKLRYDPVYMSISRIRQLLVRFGSC